MDSLLLVAIIMIYRILYIMGDLAEWKKITCYLNFRNSCEQEGLFSITRFLFVPMCK